MGLTKKEKERMKVMNEERRRKKREREEREEAARPRARLGEERASATPPHPQSPPTTSPKQTSNPTSRSSFKLDSVPEVEIKDISHRRYKIVDMDNVIEWATDIARSLNNDLTL